MSFAALFEAYIVGSVMAITAAFGNLVTASLWHLPGPDPVFLAFVGAACYLVGRARRKVLDG